MTPTPDPGLVANLRRLDPDLRLRWGRHQALWLIELKAREREPAWLAERPNPMGSTPRAMDTWEGWKDGYMYVTRLAHPITYPWAFIAEHLTHLSLEAHRAKDALLERLEAAEAEDEARAKRAWDVVNEAGAKEIYDRLAWDQGRRVSLATPAPREEPREGYVVVDRRVTVPHGE